jgi:phosphate/sulfate permease
MMKFRLRKYEELSDEEQWERNETNSVAILLGFLIGTPCFLLLVEHFEILKTILLLLFVTTIAGVVVSLVVWWIYRFVVLHVEKVPENREK